MLNVILPVLLALAGGGIGFCLRRWELAAGFDPSGLAVPFAPASVMLIILSLVLAVVIALLCRGSKNELTDYTCAFSAQNNWLYLVVCALAAAHLLIAGLFGLRAERSSYAPALLRMLLWLLCILSFFCVLVTALDNFRAKGRRYSLTLLAPAYTFCLWLVIAYQQRASDPVVRDYVYELLAIICALLGFYFTAGFSFERGKVWRCAFFCLMGVFFGIITLADSHDQTSLLLLRFAILYQLVNAIVLLHHAFVLPPKRLLKETNKTQEVTPDE